MNDKETVYRLSIQYVKRGKLRHTVVYSSSIEKIEDIEDEYLRKYPASSLTRRTYKLDTVENFFGY